MRSSYRLGTAILGALIMLGVLLGGCGTPSNSNGLYGGIVTDAPSPYGPFTRNFNPFTINSFRRGTGGDIYETLLVIDRLSGSITPWLASSYHWNSDATALTFNLRTNVKWTDGQAFSSTDVKYTLDLIHQYPALDSGGLINYISSVETPDANTVIVHFNQPSVPVLYNLASKTYIVPQHIWSSLGDPTTATNPNPVGTGPFTLGSFSAQVYTLKKNPHYWQAGKPYIDGIRFPAYDANASADLLLSTGSLDWAGVFSSDLDKTYVSRDPAHNKYWFPATSVNMLFLNLTKAPFNDLQVRKAISVAIDRQAISTQAELGYEPVASPTGLVLPANQKYLDSAYTNTTFAAASASTADSILAADGYVKDGNGIYAKNGVELKFNMTVVSGWTDWDQAVQIMATNLNAAGMSVEPNAVSFNDYIASLASATFDTAISWTNPGPTPYYLYENMLASSNIGVNSASNWGRWNDSTTDQLLAQYASSPDANVEQQAIAGLEKVMVEQLPAIPIMYGATWYEYSTARFTGWPSAQNPYIAGAPWDDPESEVVALTIHKV